jgi:hypothetical protein
MSSGDINRFAHLRGGQFSRAAAAPAPANRHFGDDEPAPLTDAEASAATKFILRAGAVRRGEIAASAERQTASQRQAAATAALIIRAAAKARGEVA